MTYRIHKMHVGNVQTRVADFEELEGPDGALAYLARKLKAEAPNNEYGIEKVE